MTEGHRGTAGQRCRTAGHGRCTNPAGTEGPTPLQAVMFGDGRRRARLAPRNGNGAGTGIWARFAPVP